jgi:protein-disulfide isomerase
MKIPGFVLVLLAAAAVVLLMLGVGPVGTGTGKRLDALEAGQKQTDRDLQEIKALLQGRAQPAAPAPSAPAPPASIPIGDSPAKGNASARVALVEFSDFQCPFCGRYTRETEAAVVKAYVDTGRVRYIYRNFPLTTIHPRALRAAEAGECAQQQNRFWPMYSVLFANQQALEEPDLPRYAQAAGLDGAAFTRCLGGGPSQRIRDDVAVGNAAGVGGTGTPTFFVGTIDGAQLKVLSRIVGAQPYAAFRQQLDAALAQSASE